MTSNLLLFTLDVGNPNSDQTQSTFLSTEINSTFRGLAINLKVVRISINSISNYFQSFCRFLAALLSELVVQTETSAIRDILNFYIQIYLEASAGHCLHG